MRNEEHESGWEVPETDAYAYQLLLSNPLREPAIRSAIEALQLPPGSRGLDAGCGIGSHTVLLAEAVEPAGHVTGLDVSPGFLAHARRMAARTGLSKRVSFQEGDVRKLPFDDGTFDWAWSVDCVGYAAQVPPPRIRELVRVVRPGGRVAIMAWSYQQLLPGYPLLEARLNATAAGIAPFIEGMRPERHFLRALGWLRDAGVHQPTAQTFVRDVQAPLSDDIRAALISLFGMRWGGAKSGVTPEDWAEYQSLCQPESPDFILDLPDYYAFFTYTLFHGKVAQSSPRMDNRMSKARFLKTMQAERERWEALLARLNATQMAQPGVTGDWSVKDIVAHVTAYEHGLVEWLEAASRGESIEFPDLDHPDVDYRNALIFQKKREWPLEEILLESKEVFRRLLQLVQALSEEDLVDPERTAWFVEPRWKEHRPLWKCIADDSYKHYHQHIPDIRAWLDQAEHSHTRA